MLNSKSSNDGKSNHSLFDEVNSLYQTEKSWSLALHFADKYGLDKVIETLHDHITIVKDYVFAYETAKERAMTDKDRLLSLISNHSNHFSHINSISKVDSDSLKAATYKINNRKYEKYEIDTDLKKSTHFINSILFKAFAEDSLA